MITVNCDNCERAFQVQDDSAGQKLACPYCGDVNRVPGLATSRADQGASGEAASAPAKVAVASTRPERMAANAASAPESEQHIAVVRQPMFRAHPFWYLAMSITFFGGLALAIYARRQEAVADWLQWAGITLMAIGLIWWLVWWMAPRRWTKLIITNKRTIRQEGIVVRRTSEVLHNHIRNVRIEQTVLQRILGVGDLSIDSAGGSEEGLIEIHMKRIPNPYRIKKMIDQFRRI